MTNHVPARRGASPAARWAPAVPPGHEWWVDNPHRLTARLNADEARGLIARGVRVELAPGVHGILVRRLRPRPPAWRGPLVVVALGVVALLALGAGALLAAREVWAARGMVVASIVCLALGHAVQRALTGHRARCVGLHCGGCKR